MILFKNIYHHHIQQDYVVALRKIMSFSCFLKPNWKGSDQFRYVIADADFQTKCFIQNLDQIKMKYDL